MNKKALTEADIRTKFITLAIVGADGTKWNFMTQLESLDIIKVDPLTQFRTPVEIVKLFGGRPGHLMAIREMETALYQRAA